MNTTAELSPSSEIVAVIGAGGMGEVRVPPLRHRGRRGSQSCGGEVGGLSQAAGAEAAAGEMNHYSIGRAEMAEVLLLCCRVVRCDAPNHYKNHYSVHL